MSAREDAKAMRTGCGPVQPVSNATNVYSLRGYVVLKFTETANQCDVVLGVANPLMKCIYCGCLSKLSPTGCKIQGFADRLLSRKPCKAAIDRQHYKCEACGHYQSEPLPSLHPTLRMTMRLYEYIQAQCATRTFTSVAREVGLSEKTIRNVFNEAV